MRNPENGAALRLEGPDSRHLLHALRRGESAAAWRVFARYTPRLRRLAESRMGRRLGRRIDPDDVVQSAYRSFFLAASGGRYAWRQPGDLWRLLAAITLNKLRKQAKRHTAGKRDCRRDAGDGLHHLADVPAAISEGQLRTELRGLSDSQREALRLQLAGHSTDQIAAALGVSSRTARRLLHDARHVLQQAITEREVRLGDGAESLGSAPPLDYADYRLERLVGAGGMGKVYAATELPTGRRVAVKALKKAWQTDERAVRQFLHEASIVRRLSHPGIILVEGVGRFPSGGRFLAMELVSGGDLHALLAAGPLRDLEAVRIVAAVADAVGHAHRQGVVHCDLKPANILLRSTGEPVVTDFGFAQLVTQASRRASLGGTVGYLAPEVLSRGARPTPAADVFSLGVLLDRLTVLTPGPLRDLCGVCQSCDPARRPADAAALLRLLREATPA